MTNSVRTNMVLAALVGSLVCVLAATAPAHAQISVPGASSALSIVLSPSHPGPNQDVTLTLSSPLYDVESSAVSWTVNGRAYQSGDGLDSITITTGKLGEETDVSASINGASGSASASIAIIPTSIDLVFESDSYTPPFYRGRALPSAGSTVTVVALPHFSAGKSTLDPSKLIYTWRRDGEVMESASGRGRSSARFDAPTLYGTDSYSVEVASQDGALSGIASLRLSAATPRLLLYEDTPLYGILFHQALGASPFVPDAEMTFFAAPLYAPVTSARDRSLQYDWTVNRTAVTATADNPNEITINAAKSNGVAAVSLSLSQNSNYFFSADASWEITFTKQPGGVPLSSDPFHP